MANFLKASRHASSPQEIPQLECSAKIYPFVMRAKPISDGRVYTLGNIAGNIALVILTSLNE